MKLDKETGRFTGRITLPGMGQVTFRRDGSVVSSKGTRRTTTTIPQLYRQVRVRATSALWNRLKPLISNWYDPAITNNFYSRITSASCSDTGVSFGLTDFQKKQGCSVIFPMLVSFGRLDPVQYDPATDTTDISLGDHPLTDDMTYGEFCTRLLENNPRLQSFDRLRLLVAIQSYMHTDSHDLPRVDPESYAICICNESDCRDDKLWHTPLSEFDPEFYSYLETVLVDDEYRLTVDRSIRNCGFAFAFSRIDERGLTYSTQFLNCRQDMWPEVLPLIKKENPKVLRS